MLLEFSCSNHKSIRSKVLFSALATSDTTLEDRTYRFGNNKVLKYAVIYGANGSGKSNFVDAIAFVQRLVANSINHQPGQGIRQMPHKLETLGTDSVYSVQFVSENIRYAYGFTLCNMLVKEEYLYYFPNGKQVKIFERNGEEFQSGSKFRGKFKACQDVLKPNRLMLSCAANFSSIGEIEAAYRFFTEDLIIYGTGVQDNWLNYSLHQIANNTKLKDTVLAFMRSLGIEAKDINVTIKKKKLNINDMPPLPPFLSDEFKSKIVGSDVDAITAKVIYPEFETDLLSEESTGVKKLFSMLCPLIDIIARGKVLICDELEASLHEALVYGLIKEFVQFNISGEKTPQIFFTTHETGLLDLNLFRRDQIWFTELKKPNRETDLYSLAEVKNVRKEENFGRGYISGKYGAIPMLNLNFADIIRNM